MKKSQNYVATLFVAFALSSAPVMAGPGVKKPPRAPEPVVEETSSNTIVEWFFNLFED